MPPHSLEAERAALGATLVSPAALDILESMLRPEDFYRHAHLLIYGALRRLASRATAADALTLTEELRTTGELDAVGGPAYVSSLVDGMPRSANVEHYAAIVREKAQLRNLIALATALASEAYAQDQPAGRLIDRGAGRLLSLATPTGSGVQTAAEIVGSYTAALDAGEIGEPVPTGYADLDHLLIGLRPCELVIVAARPSVGKTSFALRLADQVARSQKPVLFFTLEDGFHAVAARLLAWRSGVTAIALERGQATTEQYASIADAAVGFAGLPLYVECSAQTVAEVGAWCRRMADRQLSCVIVDYIQLLLPDRSRESQEAEVAGISRALKRLAKELAVPVVALSQLNRAPDGRADKRPHMSDLRGSGALEQDCNVAILLFREELHRPRPENAGIAEVIVAKNRAGPTGVVRLMFDKELALFRDLAHP